MHSYLAGLQFDLPMNKQIKAAVMNTGVSGDFVQFVWVKLDDSSYGPKGDCVIKFNDMQAWRTFERYYVENGRYVPKRLSIEGVPDCDVTRSVNLKPCDILFVMSKRDMDDGPNIIDGNQMSTLRTWNGLFRGERVLDIPWFDFRVRRHATADVINSNDYEMEEGLYWKWKNEEDTRRKIHELDFMRERQDNTGMGSYVARHGTEPRSYWTYNGAP